MRYRPPALPLVITLLAASWTLFSYQDYLATAAHDRSLRRLPPPETRVKGRMTIVASEAVKPLVSVLAAKFRHRQPDVTIAVQGAGASRSTPVDAFITGQSRMRRGDGDTTGHMGSYDAELLAMPRALTELELKQFTAKHGYGPTELVIAYRALAVYVNRRNPVKDLSVAEIDAIFSSTRKLGMPNIRTWGQLGLSGDWADKHIRLHGLSHRLRAMNAFFEHVALVDGHLKPAMNLAPGTASLVVALEKDGYGIGYGLTGMETSAVRALAVSDKPGASGVRPTAETVRSGAYPLSRAVHLYINRAPDEEWDSEAREFIHFIHSGDGREIVERAGWYALPASVAGANLKLLDGRERVRDQP